MGIISGSMITLLLFTLSADYEDSAAFLCFGRVNKSMNWSSGDTETVIISWARQGAVDRFFVPAEEPDSRAADLVPGCLSLEEGAGGSGGSAGMDKACVVKIFFVDREWEKWATDFELRNGVGTLVGVGSGGTCTWTTEGTKGRLSKDDISTSSSNGFNDRKKEANCPQKRI